MRSPILLCLLLCLLSPALTLADQVIREVPETTVGKGYGALTGMMVGAATGGPVGAIAGAGAGFWIGSSVQKESGLSGTAYEVENDQGVRNTVRSPNARFTVGQQVTQKGSRLVALPE